MKSGTNQRRFSRRRATPSKPRTANPRLILLNKPYGVVSQFSGDDGEATLKGLVPYNDVYPAGRLDKDSEGLLVLTNDGELQHKICHPKHKLTKTYWVQVEGIPTDDSLQQLCDGVELNDGITLPAEIIRMDEPINLWPRNPPVRERKSVPDCWLCIKISEGRNRQVRRMTAAIGHPTLRLIRAGIGPWLLRTLQPGEWREEPPVW
ncbi:pseudouridine synthase [Pseudidiomarina gelatinasegens]|uniref:Pseudouridine synthase n=1 Tax=Pseudidiomarina gelatinasegens TaxID=2487740 RepID=A0A443Z624_9GAMM|nr:pseudouridine synthase [Pseudidiomarina gelatinasegens]RWU12194.1 pseudouridine synthase [Pseudidiomarina gelatinasegens]